MAILSGIYPPDSGGPATFAVSFSKFASNAGYGTEILSLTDGFSNTTGSKYQSVKLISRKFGLVLRTFLVVANIVRIFLKGTRVVANGFFVETYFASILSRGSYVAKIPGDIVWERAVNSKVTNLEVRDFQSSNLSIKYKIFRYLFTKSILRAKTVIVPSPLLHELCLVWGVPQEKLKLIFNSVDVDFFMPSEFAKRNYDCIVVNRLVAWKHVDEVILACHALNLSLLVVGDGPEMSQLRRLAEELGSKVSFTGNLSKMQLLECLQSAKIYILNSTADATAYSLLEARSCGLVSVANILTGASEVINHGVDGILTKATSHSELENALAGLLGRNTSQLEAMGQRARSSTVQSFNQEINFSQILDTVVNLDA